MASRPTLTVLLAFAVVVVIGGANAIGVRVIVAEMPPLWAAAFRFITAGLLLGAWMLLRGHPIPSGTRLLGAVLFGTFGTGLSYMFLYEALRSAPAGTSMLVLAVVPMLTVLLSALQGTERLRPLALVGAVIAAIGIVIVAADQLVLDVPLVAIVLLVAGAFCMAQSGVVVKRWPPGDPVSANAFGMVVGGLLLLGASIITGETPVLPAAADTWWSMVYLIGPGSVGLFVLVLYVLARWTASATSYAFLLFPLVAIALGALLLNEPVRPSFLLGGAVVLGGVYIGAVYRPKAQQVEAVAPR
jgi:drug/metabolite transporter (DMT)-like permease